MALRYGSKNVSTLRYNSFSASALRYGNITMGMGGYDENATPARYFTFTLLDDDTYSIKAADASNLPANLVIPSSYNGKPVTQIGDRCSFTLAEIEESLSEVSGAFAAVNENLTPKLATVYVPNTITKIGDFAFAGQIYLTSISFQDNSNLTDIGVYAFLKCEGIEILTLPDGVTTIGETALGYLTGVKQITIPASVVNMASGAISWGYKNKLVLCEAESKPDGWDENWMLFASNIPPVWNCKNFNFVLDTSTDAYIIGVVDPSKLTGELYIPPKYNGKDVDTISSFAGSGATAIYYPASVTRIFPYAFDGCTSLAKFSHYEIESQGEPSIQEINMGAFRNCSALTSIFISNTTTNIGDQAFKGCSALTEIRIPTSVTIMGSKAFDNCNNLTINCYATEQPSGWASDWNPDNRPVTWGYTG